MTRFGVPQETEAEGGTGYAIARSYYGLDGAPADLSGLAAGDRLVAVVEVTPYGWQEGRLMIDDPLPAGLEIDNPSLLRGGDIGALDWLDTAEPQTAEFRADRFLAAIDRRSDRPFRVAYIVRAVTPGSFHHPAASLMDMYRPDLRGRTEADRATVTDG